MEHGNSSSGAVFPPELVLGCFFTSGIDFAWLVLEEGTKQLSCAFHNYVKKCIGIGSYNKS